MKYIILWNVFVFLVYGADKIKSIKGGFRISEKFLIFCTVFAGGIGAILGMIIFRHKTRKRKFRLMAIVGAVIAALLIRL